MCPVRFILSYVISPAKSGFDPVHLFAAAAARAVSLPRILVTDGLPAFIPAAKIFYRSAGPRFVHVREIHLHNQFNQNNVHERNGEFKDRWDGIRGMRADSPSVVSLMIIYHNFFRPHAGRGGQHRDRAARVRRGIPIKGGMDHVHTERRVICRGGGLTCLPACLPACHHRGTPFLSMRPRLPRAPTHIPSKYRPALDESLLKPAGSGLRSMFPLNKYI